MVGYGGCFRVGVLDLIGLIGWLLLIVLVLHLLLGVCCCGYCVYDLLRYGLVLLGVCWCLLSVAQLLLWVGCVD